jgi:hypothetical protein
MLRLPGLAALALVVPRPALTKAPSARTEAFQKGVALRPARAVPRVPSVDARRPHP